MNHLYAGRLPAGTWVCRMLCKEAEVSWPVQSHHFATCPTGCDYCTKLLQTTIMASQCIAIGRLLCRRSGDVAPPVSPMMAGLRGPDEIPPTGRAEGSGGRQVLSLSAARTTAGLPLALHDETYLSGAIGVSRFALDRRQQATEPRQSGVPFANIQDVPMAHGASTSHAKAREAFMHAAARICSAEGPGVVDLSCTKSCDTDSNTAKSSQQHANPRHACYCHHWPAGGRRLSLCCLES
jgi:hypothetical protein